MDMLPYLVMGLLLGVIIGYFLFKVTIQMNYVSKTQIDDLQKRQTELQLSNATKLSKEEISQNYVPKEIHETILSNLKDANETLKNERDKNEKQQSTILSLTGEIKQKVSKEEIEQNYVAKQTFDIVNAKLTSVEEDLEKKNAIILDLSTKLTDIQKDEKFLNEKLQNQKKEIEDFRKTSLTEFENIANRVLKSKTSEFTETNKTNLEAVLKPLNEEIAKFKTKVEEVYDKEAKQRFSLEERVKELVEQTNKVSSEANNLASALKGQSKKQGNWGEINFESILEKSGLVKNREYFVQPTIKDEESIILRPDILVQLPDNRTIIIDAKVSLTAYDKFSNCETKEQQDLCLTEHLKSIYGHIDNLYGKKYDNIETALDFTMMFVPIEPAYLVAIQNDPELWGYAYSKRILLISPTNLIASLKLIADIWKREYQSKNALDIVKRGELLYDKFVGFATSINSIGTHLSNTQSAYDNALSQLKDGRGNLVWQAIQLKNLGLKSSNQIPRNLIPTDVDITEDETTYNKNQ
jgi:DNA recombination protein RmuC